MIEHYPKCSPNYPEKTDGEAPRATTDIDIGDSEIARTCNDCGAYEIIAVDANPHSLSPRHPR